MGSRKIGKYIRLNASRSGVSASVGVKGMRLSIGSKGIRSHLTVPGTGYTKTNTLFSFKKLLKGKGGKSKGGKSDTAAKGASDMKEDMPEQGFAVADELLLQLGRRRAAGRFGKAGKAARLYNQGVEAYYNKDYDLSAGSFEEALSLLPEDQEILLCLGILNYLYLEDYEKAVRYFDGLDEAVFNEDMKLAIAASLHELRDWDYSIAVLEAFEFPDDEDMERRIFLARNHMAKGHITIAEEILKQTIGKKRKMTTYLMEAKYRLGSLYLDQGDYLQAKEHLMAVYMADSGYEDIGRQIEILAMHGPEG